MPKNAFVGLPSVGQIGVVVPNVDRAVEFFSQTLGLGPFRVVERERVGAMVRGKTTTYRLKVALAQIGDLELELIQPLAGDSLQMEFAGAKGAGLHHLGFFVHDIQKYIDAFAQRGYAVIQSDRTQSPHFAYLDTEAEAGFMLELIERE